MLMVCCTLLIIKDLIPLSINLMSDHWFFTQEKERAKDLEQASKFCENICNDFVSIASSSESAGRNPTYFSLTKCLVLTCNELNLKLNSLKSNFPILYLINSFTIFNKILSKLVEINWGEDSILGEISKTRLYINC